jgi:hydroxymethylpyrimidine pyrophosphatase-like HAD family hydrolase
MRGDTAAGHAPLPVDACVAENGAVAFVRNPGGLTKHHQQDAPTRAANYARLQAVAADIVRTVSGACLSQDSAGRETDIAIDHSEFTQLPPECIAQVVARMEAAGMHATVSSIHINGWLGEHNKLSGARWMVRKLLGRNLDDELDRWVYVGDSTNDELMFRHLAQSVGVANIARFASHMHYLPRYVTTRERGAGFAEVAAALLAARPAP